MREREWGIGEKEGERRPRDERVKGRGERGGKKESFGKRKGAKKVKDEESPHT